jgi:transcriptional antiterminator NusG
MDQPPPNPALEPSAPLPKGRWFVLNTLTGHEAKAKQALESRVASLGLTDRIFEVLLPTDDVAPLRNKKRKVVSPQRYPGYLFVRCHLDAGTWAAIRHTPGLTGFAGQGPRDRLPAPMSESEVASMLAPTSAALRPSDIFQVGESVQVQIGPFSGFLANVAEVDSDRLRLKVVLSVFGRETLAEFGFDEVRRP